MNKKLLKIALIFLMPVTVCAKTPAAPIAPPVTVAPLATEPQPESPRQGKFEELVLKLNVSPEQRVQLKPIFEKRREQVKALKQEPNPLQRKLAALTLMQQTRAEVEKILTPEQMQQLIALQQQRLLKKYPQTPPAQP